MKTKTVLLCICLLLIFGVQGSASPPWDFRWSHTHYQGDFTYYPIAFSPVGCYKCNSFECDGTSCAPQFDYIEVEWWAKQKSSGQVQTGSRTLNLSNAWSIDLYLTGTPRCSLALSHGSGNAVMMTSASCYPYEVDLELTWWDDWPFGE